MAKQGRHLTRTQVMAWVEPWSYTDRAWITAALDAIPSGVCVLPPSGGYIGVWSNDQRALTIHPGYLVWPGGRWTQGPAAGPVPGHARGRAPRVARAVHLPAARPRDARRRRGRDAICPSCTIAIPLTGVCDDCG